MIKAVVFDLGGVLASPPSLLPLLAARMGTTHARVAEHYWSGRDAYDAGGSTQDYWGPLVAAAGGSASEGLLDELALLDASVWSELRPQAWQVLRDCRSAGVIVAILSNSPHAVQSAADGAQWRRDVDHLFVSATLGMMKPDPAIYRAVADQLGLPGAELAFIDDKQANVDGALAVGWRAHLWTDDADTRDWLVAVGVLER
ncbi:HAD family hydrolase [Tessaracoccus antarcticus]|uniref:HAD family phosphatase n=1 Tax=Tessaracoccus antarcticus TaxID=2479848 RepID=A0A3M0G822_9ACTN|nr:HAD family phosphatase [Tessaracoccus antarcticus]RMB61181.1 HAD family phosphatase [Tessaracoccus antarcticus]